MCPVLLYFSCVLKDNSIPTNTTVSTKDSIIKSNSIVIDAENIPLDKIKKGSNPNEKSSEYIEKTIEQLIGKTLKKWTEEANVAYPPACVLFRVFKVEHEYEIWGGDSQESMKLIQTIKICSFDDEPGPKLTIGDNKTPEGFYTCDISYGSQYWWMWIKLSADEIDKRGDANYGSSFKLCTNYPNSSDQARTRQFSKNKNPGSEICIHGNCVSAGCISFKNRAFLPVYYFAKNHNTKKFGSIQVHMFPFRFSEKLKKQYCGTYNLMDSKSLNAFWSNLEEGYTLFNQTHKTIKYQYQKDKYVFNK